MWMDPKDTRKQLSAIWNNDEVLTLDTKRKKYVLLSDLHLGNGGGADDFHHNEKVLLNALEYYRSEKFSIILMGDIEELWQFDLPEITSRYCKTIYNSLKKFGDNRIYRIHGNHDFKWRGMRDPVFNEELIVGSGVEAIKLRDINNRISILLIHGHQGNLESDKYKFLGRFGARIYRYIEPICKKIFPSKSTSKPMSNIPDNYEAIYYGWAKKEKVLICCGHTHRAIFSSISYIERLQREIDDLKKEIKECSDDEDILKIMNKIYMKTELMKIEISRGRKIETTDISNRPKSCYFNTGCGTYNDGLTTIEIQHNDIRLVKWSKKNNRTIYQSGKLTEFIKEF